MNVAEALTTRISATNLADGATIDEAEVTELVRLAQEAPSSFNIQFTRFVAVTDPALKAQLREAGFNQAKFTDAAVVFVLLGDLKAHEDYAVRMRAAAAAGHVPQGVADYLVNLATQFYTPTAGAREESARSVGLSAMALMLAAEERGWASCPMISFNPAAFSEILGISERYVPLMVVVVGKGLAANPPRKQRLAASDVLRFNGAGF
ncbi:putative NAD(P)H nitroreductase YodC [Deltaproteobacteria bacterium]|nr:putative NAD(P)H nitroreductase YodC [Deltaproteobacteria bacterium]